jgi:putative toxin-antitoxin system antitoxin component (TIGR02293 family)
MFGMALDLFAGELEEARRWFVAPQVALGGAAPIDYAVTDVGSRELETFIGRLEHGIVC